MRNLQVQINQSVNYCNSKEASDDKFASSDLKAFRYTYEETHILNGDKLNLKFKEHDGRNNKNCKLFGVLRFWQAFEV